MKIRLVPWEPTRFLNRILIKLQFSRRIFEKNTENLKFHENPSRPVGADTFFKSYFDKTSIF